MKVLWFSNTSANADEYLNVELRGTGGWLKSLDLALQNYVELHIAFNYQNDKAFKYKETFYHPIMNNQNLFKKIYNKYTRFVSDKQDLSKYLKIIDTVKPDIIHIHGTENAFACIILHTSIPVVVSIQGNITVYLHKFFSGFESKYLYITNRKVTSLKALFFPEAFVTGYQRLIKMHKREERNLKFVKYIIGRTLWDKRITRIMAPESIYYQGDEILRGAFYQYHWEPHFSDKLIIHTTNSNIFYKGFETLCEALNLLNKIGFNCEWRIAGINPEDLIVKLTKKKLKKEFPQQGLVLLGSINENSLINYLLESDLYVMASHIENSPNNLCEAMMLGMPCISTFAGGVGTLIKDDENGLLIQDGDPWAMAGAILEFANNEVKAIQFGRNARTIAMQRHDKNRIIEALLQTYSGIISDKNNS